MAIIHFLNVLEGDCNIIQHDTGRVSVIDVSNAYNEIETEEEKIVKQNKEKTKFDAKVPEGKVDFKQKGISDNPIEYLKKLKLDSIWRFIISHPDMDHLDGIEDLFNELKILHTWDTDNNKVLEKDPKGGRYNKNDWNFYNQIRDGKYVDTKRLALTAGDDAQFYKEDRIKVLCPTPELIKSANSDTGDYHDLSYVLLFEFPKKDGKSWKILFAGDSHDASWDYILKNHEDEVSNIDVLFAPHHGRDSNRSYEFLKILNPRLTLMGNASSNHLAYNCYKPIRITNNQAGYVVLDINTERIFVLVKNKAFADSFRNRRGWLASSHYPAFDAFGLFQFSA